MVKKLYILFLLTSFVNLGLFSQVYQLPNRGFENWDGTSDNSEPTNWNGFPSAVCDLTGIASLGCNTATATRHQKSNDTRPGSSGSYSCKIYSTKISILGNTVIANGTMTTGQIRIGNSTASSTENYNITRTGDSQFRQSINAKPDSIVFWAKFVCPSTTQKARVSAIIHDSYSYRDPDGSDANSPSHVVAKAVHNFTRGNQTWIRYSIPFNYNYPASTPTYILLTFTTNMIAGEGSDADVLFIDDVEFIYNTALTKISINGTAMPGFSSTIYDYYVNVNCGSVNTVTANAKSVNATVNITQSSGTNPSIITVNSGDQTSTYRVFFNYTNISLLSDEICMGQAYTLNGFNLPVQNTAGVFEFVSTTYESEICDSVVRLSLRVNPTFKNDTLEIMICENAEYNFYGTTLTEPGIYKATLSSISGCDSLITLNLSVGDFYRTYINASICQGDIYNENGFNANTEKIDSLFYIAHNNCDSLVILNLNINPSYETQFIDTITEGSVYIKNGFIIPIQEEEGSFDYNLELLTEFGCDSLLMLKLIVIPRIDTIPEPNGNFSFSVYPVPAAESLTITSSSDVNTDLNFIVFDMFGKKIMSGKILSTDTVIDISELASGIYFIKITYPIDKTLIYKFIIN